MEQDENSDDEEQDVVLADETAVIDPENTSLERISGDTLVFNLSNSSPDLAADDIVVGKDKGGFLRKVTSVAEEGNKATLITERASIVEALDRGKLNVDFDLSGAERKSWKWKAVETAKGVKAKSNGLGVEMNNVRLTREAGFAVTFENGEASFDPSVDFQFDVGLSGLQELRLAAQGELGFQTDVKATAEGRVQGETTKSLARFTAGSITFNAGPFPVTITPVLEFVAGYQANAEASGTVSTGIQSTNRLTLGAHYKNGSWSPVSDRDATLSSSGIDWDTNLSAQAKGYVKPELTFKIYSGPGPFVNAGPYVRAKTQVNPSFECGIYSGLDAGFGGSVEFMSYGLARFEHTYSIAERELLDRCGKTEASVSGSVTDSETGKGLENVSISGSGAASGEELFSTSTDGSGAFDTTFEVRLDEKPDSLTISASTGGYNSSEKTIPFAESMTADFGLSPVTAQLYLSSEDGFYKIDTETAGGELFYESSSNPTAGTVELYDHLYAGWERGEVQRIDTKTGEVEWNYTSPDSAVVAMTVGPDGYVYAGSCDPALHRVSAETGQQDWTYAEHEKCVARVSLGANGHVYASGDSDLHKIDAQTGEREWATATSNYDGFVQSVATGPDGSVYVGTANLSLDVNGMVSRVDPDTGAQEWSYSADKDMVTDVTVSSGGHVYAAAFYNDEVHKINPTTGEQEWTYTAPSNPVLEVSVGPKGDIYAAPPGSLHKIDGDTGEQEWVLDYSSTDWIIQQDDGESARGQVLPVEPGESWISQGLAE
ncbi:hypothetical protein BSZ35_18420 [Salinibacter sp. 10B]|uniref:outer membrane protein assembly factor BamB family protein n=1 Tax=Salinibacter sp. 10B TaxID=1923971 RepID=UPI000D277C5D|nr:PQQ-binding-like beta-propeller repeat protein [Salinibacter sp. 10B]PQJ26903.1 hypothetical protein BSZ35_18420 [Salinibacter sp. 10B]